MHSPLSSLKSHHPSESLSYDEEVLNVAQSMKYVFHDGMYFYEMEQELGWFETESLQFLFMRLLEELQWLNFHHHSFLL